jgi:uncharacterized membrane protein
MGGTGSSQRRELVFDWAFLVGVLLKAVDGLIEVVVGIPLLFLSTDQVAAFARTITAGELAEDPNDFLANLIVREVTRIDHHGIIIAAIYLLVHGVVKLAIVLTLWVGSRRAYPWAIGALTVLLVVQLVDLVLRFTVGVLLLTVLDLVIILLTFREWQHQRTLHQVIDARLPWLGRRRRPT